MLRLATRLCGRRHFSKRSLKFSNEVERALIEKKPIVALESTVITHGLPRPVNLETARSLEEIVRTNGAIPATIALINGQINVGLSDEQLQHIANSDRAIKVSKRDIARTLETGEIGGTTVAATMYIANMAGIPVFATGGIGGVHRGAEETFDISADLLELAETPVAVVCAGVKSILDIAKTVEFLLVEHTIQETHSVNTIVYGHENVFPGFFTRKTSAKGQFASMDLTTIAGIIETSKELGLRAGTILACPLPETLEAEGGMIEQAIQTALREAKEQGISGQASTPFLLSRVKELTKGASMATNIGLLQNNARIGAELSKAIHTRQRYTKKETSNIISLKAPTSEKAPVMKTSEEKAEKKIPLVTTIGAAICDFEAITHSNVKNDGASYPGIVMQRCGGVGRNHADAIGRLKCESVLITCTGNDNNGEFLRSQTPHIDYSLSPVIAGVPTAVYMSMNVKGTVVYGISSIEEIVKHITPELIRNNADVIQRSDFVVLDGNLPTDTLATAVDIASSAARKIWFEPADVHKVEKIFTKDSISAITAFSPNANEFRTYCKFAGVSLNDSLLDKPHQLRDFIGENDNKMFFNMECFIVTLAEKGSVVFRKVNGKWSNRVLPAAVMDPSRVVSVSGAGDSFNAGVIAGWVHDVDWFDSLDVAQYFANLTLKTTEAVSPDITAMAYHF